MSLLGRFIGDTIDGGVESIAFMERNGRSPPRTQDLSLAEMTQSTVKTRHVFTVDCVISARDRSLVALSRRTLGLSQRATQAGIQDPGLTPGRNNSLRPRKRTLSPFSFPYPRN